jgi:hypothetical protein
VWGLFLSLEPPSYGSRGVDHPLPPYSPGGVSYPRNQKGEVYLIPENTLVVRRESLRLEKEEEPGLEKS